MGMMSDSKNSRFSTYSQLEISLALPTKQVRRSTDNSFVIILNFITKNSIWVHSLCFLCTVKNIKLTPVAVWVNSYTGERCKEMAGGGWGHGRGTCRRKGGEGGGGGLVGTRPQVQGGSTREREGQTAPLPSLPFILLVCSSWVVPPPTHRKRTVTPTSICAHTHTHALRHTRSLTAQHTVFQRTSLCRTAFTSWLSHS